MADDSRTASAWGNAHTRDARADGYAKGYADAESGWRERAETAERERDNWKAVADGAARDAQVCRDEWQRAETAERLSAVNDDARRRAEQENAKLRAENRKLRDALRRIAESGEYVQGWQLRERARAALAATEEPDGTD